MKKSKNAFTMIELVFVIVVLGILAAVAVPKFAATRLDAQISKGKADVASIRSAIVTERQSRLIKGDSTWITEANMDSGGLFGGVLTYGISNESGVDGKWSATAGSGTYQFRLKGANNTFVYYDSTEADTTKRGKFLCTGGTYCSQLTD